MQWWVCVTCLLWRVGDMGSCPAIAHLCATVGLCDLLASVGWKSRGVVQPIAHLCAMVGLCDPLALASWRRSFIQPLHTCVQWWVCMTHLLWQVGFTQSPSPAICTCAEWRVCVTCSLWRVGGVEVLFSHHTLVCDGGPMWLTRFGGLDISSSCCALGRDSGSL